MPPTGGILCLSVCCYGIDLGDSIVRFHHSVLHSGLQEEEDEGWTRPTIEKALLLHIENVALNCSLTMIDSKYPVKYPNGRGSSHQFVVGCLPTTAADLNDRNYLWQLQQVLTEVSLTQSVSRVEHSHWSKTQMKDHDVTEC